MTKEKTQNLKIISNKIRLEVLKMIYEAGSGHLGSAMSVIEVLVALYFGGILKFDPKKPDWKERDYFLLSNGHACPSLYAILAEAGYFPKSLLKDSLFQLNSGLEGHPVKGSLPGIEISSGSLGMGLAVGLGIAMGLRIDGKQNKVLVMMSDGEQQEGSCWEAVMATSYYKASNLIGLVDRNGIQIGGRTESNLALEPLVAKYQAFGWDVIEIDGHNFTSILDALKKAYKNRFPTVIICKTIPARGVFRLEGDEFSHHPSMNKEIFIQTFKKLKQKNE